MAVVIRDIENKLWQAADALRGNLSAEEYMHTVLGILSLKYISDRYDIALKRLENHNSSIHEISSDEFYYNYHSFLVPKEAQWDTIASFANDSNIGKKLDEAFSSLEEKNSMLKNVFNRNYNREEIDARKLGDVIKIFSDEDFTQDSSEDLVGRIYEYFLGHFFKNRGQKGGEFYTPDSIVKLMVNILKPNWGSIYDPAVGTAGMLVQAKRYIENHGGAQKDIVVYGQEYNNVTWKLAKLNLVLNGFGLLDPDNHGFLGDKSADTFNEDLHQDKKFDFILANPPFNMKSWGYEGLINDSRWRWGVPPKSNANYAWLSHIVSKLGRNGKAAVVLANGSLSSSKKEEYSIRQSLINDNKVEAILELPDKLFYTTGIPASIWFFNNSKKTNNILMISASNFEGNMISKKLRELTDEEIYKISDVYSKHEQGESVNEIGFAKSVVIKDLEDNDWSCVPGRYVGSIEEEIDTEKTKIEIKEISDKLFQLLDEFKDLEPKLKDSIKKALAFDLEN